MTDVSSWLRGQRKYELVELAQEAGLKDYEHLKKMDLEIALDEYLRANETSLSEHSLFNPFYTQHRSTQVSAKRETAGSGTATAAPPSDGDAKAVKARTRRVTKAADEVAPTDDSSPDAIGNKVTFNVTRTPRQSVSLVASVPLPPSPAQVADVIDSSTAEIRSKVGDVWRDAGMTERAEALRESLSSVVSIETVVLAIEALGLRSEVLPSRYAFTLPAVAGLGSSGWPVYLPDLFMLLTASFWGPVTLWASTNLFVPLVFAYFFNLTLKAKHSHTGGHPHPPAQPMYTADPLTFNIVKALATYVIYSQRVNFGGFLADDSIETIRRAVPGGVEGLLIGSGIGAITSIYDAILKI